VKAAETAFAQGDDELVERALERGLDRFPEAAALHQLQAELARYRGEYEAGRAAIERARMLDPRSAAIATSAIHLWYLSAASAEADEVAVEAVRRFPRTANVLWAAAKRCDSVNQFERLLQAWAVAGTGAKNLTRSVRQLSNAAARVDRLDIAIELYLRASVLELEGEGKGRPPKQGKLAGKSALSVLKDVREALEGAGVPYFFAAGTVLGIVRDGKPFDHDDDIDVGVMDDDWDREELESAFTRHPRFVFDVPHPRNRKIGLVHRSGAGIDLFRFYREGDRLWHDGVFVRWYNTPFTVGEREVGGGRVRVPEPVEQYLAESYGQWRVPDTSFDAFVDAPNMEVVWPEYYAYHRVRRAYRAVLGGERKAAREELEAVRDSVVRSSAGRHLLELIESRVAG